MTISSKFKSRVWTAFALVVLAILGVTALPRPAPKLQDALQLWQEGRKVEAIYLYEKILAQNSHVSEIELPRMYAVVARELERTDAARAKEFRLKAEEAIQRQVAAGPANALRIYGCAVIYDRTLNEPRRALEFYQKAIPLLSNDIIALAAGLPTADRIIVSAEGKDEVMQDYKRTLGDCTKRVAELVRDRGSAL